MLAHLKCHCKAKTKLVENLKALLFTLFTLPTALLMSPTTRLRSKANPEEPSCLEKSVCCLFDFKVLFSVPVTVSKICL